MPLTSRATAVDSQGTYIPFSFLAVVATGGRGIDHLVRGVETLLLRTMGVIVSRKGRR